MFIRAAELGNKIEFNLNNLNNINNFNHLIGIEADKNNVNLQPNCFNVDPSNSLQIPLAENILFFSVKIFLLSSHLSGALPLPCVPARVTRGVLVARCS